MLGKLIKYDFKALNRYLIVIHGMLLITAAIGRFLFVGRMVQNPDSTPSSIGMIIMVIGILVYVILFMAALFGTLLLIAVHFYKNLYSDEGYLTHTLPVSRGQLLASKAISGSVWMLIDMILVIFSVMILVLYKPTIQEFIAHKDEALTAMGFPASVGYGKIFLALAVMFVLSAVSGVITLYVSIAVGQLFSNHRVLGAIVAYFGISMVISIVGGAIGAAFSISAVANATDESFIYQFYCKTYLFAAALNLVTIAGAYVVTYLLMKKKLNLN